MALTLRKFTMLKTKFPQSFVAMRLSTTKLKIWKTTGKPGKLLSRYLDHGTLNGRRGQNLKPFLMQPNMSRYSRKFNIGVATYGYNYAQFFLDKDK